MSFPCPVPQKKPHGAVLPAKTGGSAGRAQKSACPLAIAAAILYTVRVNGRRVRLGTGGYRK